MIITEETQRACQKAQKVKCRVRVLAGRRYLMTTPESHSYVVRMEEREGVRYAVCHCAAGSASMPCFHICSAAVVDDVRVEGRAILPTQRKAA
jgi:hypothetical protein